MQILLKTIKRGISFTVQDYQSALLYRNGAYKATLTAGKYRFWNNGYTVMILDKRDQQLVVQGQEVLTSDHVVLKVSALATYRVVDALTLTRAIAEPYALLYTDLQLALREVVSASTAEDFLSQKNLQDEKLTALMTERCKQLGVEFHRVALRDVMLPGELKRSFMSALQQRQEAHASLEKARAETATLRTLANAAKLMRDNPELLQLRYLDTLNNLRDSKNTSLVLGLTDSDKLKVAMKA